MHHIFNHNVKNLPDLSMKIQLVTKQQAHNESICPQKKHTIVLGQAEIYRVQQPHSNINVWMGNILSFSKLHVLQKNWMITN
jgi:hypothetical protein